MRSEVGAIHDANAASLIDPAAGESRPAGREILDLVQKSLEQDKGEDVVVIDLAEKSTMADYMVVVSGRSSRQVSAMAEHLMERLKAAGSQGLAAEGLTRGDWVLVDAGDVIVHLFRPEVRNFYNLEKMWASPVIDDIAAERAHA
jgi:ribosome-associated protein